MEDPTGKRNLKYIMKKKNIRILNRYVSQIKYVSVTCEITAPQINVVDNGVLLWPNIQLQH